MRIRLCRKLTFGMTLMEVIMATGIIAITGAGVISSINYGLCIMRIARENQRPRACVQIAIGCSSPRIACGACAFRG